YDSYKPIKEIFAEFGVAASDNVLYEIGLSQISCYDISTFKALGDIEYDGQPVPRRIRSKTTPNGKKLYIGAPGWGKEATGGLFVIDLDQKKQLKILEENKINTGLIGMSDDGKYVYTAVIDGLKIINTDTDSEYKTIRLTEHEHIQDIIAGENYTIYLITYHYDSDSSKDYKFRVVYLNKGILKTINLTSDEYKVFRLLLNSGGRYLYIIGNEKIVKFDTSTLSVESEKAFPYWAAGAAISPDGKLLFVQALKENKVIVYDTEKGAAIKEIPFKKDLYDILVK
ncbi:MAG: hypothetical protein NT145_00215, partial [Elusimicrobia bacterium]|nr:hypothetical protein [Elusimicrobiota bacterium]